GINERSMYFKNTGTDTLKIISIEVVDDFDNPLITSITIYGENQKIAPGNEGTITFDINGCSSAFMHRICIKSNSKTGNTYILLSGRPSANENRRHRKVIYDRFMPESVNNLISNGSAESNYETNNLKYCRLLTVFSDMKNY
ncbi:MAG: hypothetical protein ACRC3B_04100, partial [Bacteroidia bacterium]